MEPATSPSPAGVNNGLSDVVRHGVRIGPDCFASPDSSVICWRGRNYVPQPAPVVNAEERPEDTARRYARQLLALQSGLRERGWSLDHCGEDGIVNLALAALDERDADAKANAEIANRAGPDALRAAADDMGDSPEAIWMLERANRIERETKPAERPD